MRGEYFALILGLLRGMELPPRARRILGVDRQDTIGGGTTSACAENTPDGAGTPWIPRNYLRVRGEYPHLRIALLFRHELPPRARRIHFHHHFKNVTHGTTSACAENTVRSSSNPAPLRNYLRVRGEYLALAERLLSSNGTTSACAENTWIGRMRSPPRGNYLRVRGEYSRRMLGGMGGGELPPRARRIPGHGCCIAHNQGTTSACAENTIEDDAGVAHAGNYLRVRGEYGVPGHMMDMDEELPPRARRIRGAHAIRVSQPGTTSACAENTRRKQRKLP